MTRTERQSDLIKPLALIGGQWVGADDGCVYTVTNPASGGFISEVAECGAAETKRAIDAAQDAFPNWAKLSANDRSAILMNWYHLLVDRKAELSELLVREQGKPLREATGEILYGASYVKWFAEEARRIHGDVLCPADTNSRLFNIKQPVGVVACITPWNFPNAMLARKIAPALAAGCTVVCKPANETPLSAFALGELALRAGVPEGVINIVSGRTEEIGETLTSDPRVRKLTFTGSTRVGKLLTKQCAGTLKRLSMELGGNAPFIVFDSADVDAAVAGFMANKFRNAGQTCVCANRVFVQSSIAAAFGERLKVAMKELVSGNGLDEATTIGPLISRNAKMKVSELVNEAISAGANLERPCEGARDDANFYPPSILSGVKPSMRIFSEEVFGPVVSVIQFETEDQAVALANDTPFGLAGYFYSRDFSQVWRVSEALEVGMVGVNQPSVSNESIPFGGVKESGQGREGSTYGLDDYLEIKHINIGGLTNA